MPTGSRDTAQVMAAAECSGCECAARGAAQGRVCIKVVQAAVDATGTADATVAAINSERQPRRNESDESRIVVQTSLYHEGKGCDKSYALPALYKRAAFEPPPGFFCTSITATDLTDGIEMGAADSVMAMHMGPSALGDPHPLVHGRFEEHCDTADDGQLCHWSFHTATRQWDAMPNIICDSGRFGPLCNECQCSIGQLCDEGIEGSGQCFRDVEKIFFTSTIIASTSAVIGLAILVAVFVTIFCCRCTISMRQIKEPVEEDDGGPSPWDNEEDLTICEFKLEQLSLQEKRRRTITTIPRAPPPYPQTYKIEIKEEARRSSV